MTTKLRGMTLAAAAVALVAPLAACNSEGGSVGTSSAVAPTSTSGPTMTKVSPIASPPSTTSSAATTTSSTASPTSTTTTEQADRVIHVKSRAGFMVGPTKAACLLNAAGVTCADGMDKPYDIPGVKCPSDDVAINAAILNADGEVGGACGGDVAYLPESGDAAWASGLGLQKVHGAPVLTQHVILVDDASNITCKVSTLNENWLDCAYQEGVIRMTIKPTGVAFQGATPKLLDSTVNS
ncbi:hypothetical protein [Flexivirga oryzae]|uniref:Uncharacterized protein n=1 Tax=Flexivirga oryzae TaxID=1794944 RepID=A0A839MZX5_9MICO|nr:hypothetical protein [Flexivirga oryzae]MBB2890667.1 hypothetical protein [Flexivirga oryzae]